MTETLKDINNLIRPYCKRQDYCKKIRNWFILICLILGLTTTTVVAIVTKNWLWAIFAVALFTIIGSITSNVMKEEVNLCLRKIHFLMAITCRAHNNRLFLQHGIELRPGYLGKFLECNAIKIKSRSRYLYMVEQRVNNQDLGDDSEGADIRYM